MFRWMYLFCAGCLVVVEPEETPADKTFPIGDVHPCTIEMEQTTAYWTVCFSTDEHLDRFERDMVLGCAYNGIECTVKCSTRDIRPCLMACPGSGFLPSACNASHGCYCPVD